MQRIRKVKLLWNATALAILAGIAYNSWPLGFFLNPRVSNGGGLASELEGLGQPYNWVFVLLDIVTGALVMAVVALMWRKKMKRGERVALVSFGLFGLFTIVDALLPMPCEPSVKAACASWTTDHLLLMHGVASIASAVFLFVSGFLVWHLRRIHNGAFTMRLLMTAWLVFGILSIYFFFTPGPGFLSQDYYLILSGIWVGAMPALIQLDAAKRQKVAPKRIRA